MVGKTWGRQILQNCSFRNFALSDFTELLKYISLPVQVEQYLVGHIYQLNKYKSPIVVTNRRRWGRLLMVSWPSVTMTLPSPWPMRSFVIIVMGTTWNQHDIDYSHVTSVHAQKASEGGVVSMRKCWKCWTVGLFDNFPYQIRHNLVELFKAKTSLTVVYYNRLQSK